MACLRGTDGCDIDPLVAPAAGDVVFEKQQPSAFFGTDLHDRLGALGVDTVVVCGTTTSGCVRATVVDGMSLGYRMIVPVEAVSDRARTPHRSALFDMGHKYADVLPERDVLGALAPLGVSRRRSAPAPSTCARPRRRPPTIAFARARRTAMPLTIRKSAISTNENSVVSTPSAKMYGWNTVAVMTV